MRGQVRGPSNRPESDERDAAQLAELQQCSERVDRLEREFEHLRQLLRRLAAEPRGDQAAHVGG